MTNTTTYPRQSHLKRLGLLLVVLLVVLVGRTATTTQAATPGLRLQGDPDTEPALVRSARRLAVWITLGKLVAMPATAWSPSTP